MRLTLTADTVSHRCSKLDLTLKGRYLVGTYHVPNFLIGVKGMREVPLLCHPDTV